MSHAVLATRARWALPLLLSAALLAACGGGDQPEDAQPAPAEPAFVVAEEAPAPTSPTTTITESGSLTYVVNAGGGAGTVTASVSATSTEQGSGTLTVTVGTTTVEVTTASGEAENFSLPDVSGRLDLQGNVALICQLEGVNTSLALVSHNLDAVTSLGTLTSRNYTGTDCAAPASPGTVYRLTEDGAVETAEGNWSAEQVQALFSANGLTEEGNNYKWRAYSYGSGSTTRYVIVSLFTESGTTTPDVELLVSDLAPN